MLAIDSWDSVADWLGFALLAGSAVTAVLCVAVWRRGGKRVATGASLTLFLATTLAMADQLMPASALTAGAHRAVTEVLATLAVLAAAFTIDALLRRFVWYGRLRRGDQSGVPEILIGLASLGIYLAAAMVVAAQVFGHDVTALAATSGVLAVVLGYSAQPTLSEVFAGLALNLSRPFRIGDSVQIDGIWGVVVESGWRSISLRTYDGNLVVLPNSKAASQRLTNLDLPNHQLRQAVGFVADIDAPPGRVQAVGVAAMAGMAYVLPTPAPRVLVKELTEQGVAYEALFWHDDPNLSLLRRDEVAGALWYAFHRAGIRLAVNRRLQAAPEATVPADAAGPARQLRDVLGDSPLYRPFPPEALDRLAGQHRIRLYGPGERVIRQAEPGESMFVILEGTASVRLERGGGEQEIHALGPGRTFGHMSLMTGAARLATVRAVSHLVLAELDKAAIAPLLAAYPTVVDGVAQEILEIEAADRALRQPDQGVDDPGHARVLDNLADRIRSFFTVG